MTAVRRGAGSPVWSLAFVAFLLLEGLAGEGGELLDRVRQLYEAARFEQALELLDSTGSDAGVPVEDSLALADYRTLCLLALDRVADAEAVVERRIRERPDYSLVSEDVSPRLRAFVSGVRLRVLPALVRAEYAAGKADYAGQRIASAARSFRRVVALLDDPGLEPEVKQPLAGLSELAKEYLDLIEAATAPAGAGAAPVLPLRDQASVVFTAENREVVPPVAIHRAVPPWRPPSGRPLPGQRRATMRIAVDEKGRVRSAQMVGSLTPMYDRTLLDAAKRWTYKPATRNGSPVQYLLLMEVVIGADQGGPTSSSR